MAKCGYEVHTTASVALVAATAKSILGVRANAAFGVDLLWYDLGSDGAISTATPMALTPLVLTQPPVLHSRPTGAQ